MRAFCRALELLWFLGGLSCLVAAAWVIVGARRSARLEEAAAAFDASRRRRRAAYLLLGGLLPAVMALYKLVQFHSLELMFDTGITSNMLWNAAHGYGLYSSVLGGESFFATHFSFFVLVFVPLVRLWESTAALAVAHGLAVGSTLLAVHLLGRRLCGSALAAWLLTLLTLSNYFFHELWCATVNNHVFILPLGVWMLCAWEHGRKRAAAVVALLLLTTLEQMPFLFFGLGLYAWVASERGGAGRRAALALCAGSVALFLGELAVIEWKRAGLPPLWDSWRNFSGLGGSPEAVLARAATRPWEFAAALVWPWPKLLRAAGVLLSLAALPVAAGATAIPGLFMWLPQQLADEGSPYHRLSGVESAYVFAPLLWACAHGLARAWSEQGGRFRPLAAGAVLLASGAGFLRSANFLQPDWLNPAHWRETVPRALSAVPPGASVWCDEFFLPHLAMRRYVKAPTRNRSGWFERGLFVPDRVVFSAHWFQRADPDYVKDVSARLKEWKFAPVFQERDVIVLANPETFGREGAEPRPTTLR